MFVEGAHFNLIVRSVAFLGARVGSFLPTLHWLAAVDFWADGARRSSHWETHPAPGT